MGFDDKLERFLEEPGGAKEESGGGVFSDAASNQARRGGGSRGLGAVSKLALLLLCDFAVTFLALFLLDGWRDTEIISDLVDDDLLELLVELPICILFAKSVWNCLSELLLLRRRSVVAAAFGIAILAPALGAFGFLEMGLYESPLVYGAGVAVHLPTYEGKYAEYLRNNDPAGNEARVLTLASSSSRWESSHGMFCLAECYFDGYGVKQDYQQALDLYVDLYEDRRYTQEGYKTFWQRAGACYYGAYQEDGTILESSLSESSDALLTAQRCFEEGSERGSDECDYMLGEMYREGTASGGQDGEKAISYYSRAADAGHVQAQVSLGVLYYTGEFGNRSYEFAVHYWELAADAGNLVAIYNLGVAYYYGNGVEEDKEAALAFFEEAEAGGNEKAGEFIDGHY